MKKYVFLGFTVVVALLFTYWLLFHGWLSFSIDLPNGKTLQQGAGYPLASLPNKGGVSFVYTDTYEGSGENHPDPELYLSIGQVKEKWEENGRRDYEDMWWAINPHINLKEFHVILLVLYPDGNLERYDWPEP